MQNNLLVAGIACIMAALIGGGLRAFTIEIPLLSSVRRQIMLGLFGAFLMTLSLAQWGKRESAGPSIPTPVPTESSSSSSAKQVKKPAADRDDKSQASPSASSPAQQPAVQGISLAKSSFLLPDDGIAMNNAQVGPFCCTGNVVIVRNADGNPAGYIYFYSWKGQAYNVAGGSIVPDFAVLVSGPALSGDTGSDQQKGQIEFQADQLNPQSSWIQAGLLQYRATVLDFKLERGPLFKPYFKMDSLKVRVDVRPATSA
jgi:hypothetical protein